MSPADPPCPSTRSVPPAAMMPPPGLSPTTMHKRLHPDTSISEPAKLAHSYSYSESCLWNPQTAIALSVLALTLATGFAISALSTPNRLSGHLAVSPQPIQIHHAQLLLKRLPPPPITSSTITAIAHDSHHQSSIPNTPSQQASTESHPVPLHHHPPPPSANTSSSISPPDRHPLDTCADYDDLNLLTRESVAYYSARGGLSRRDFATAVRDCELRNYECVRFQVVHGEVYAVHPVPAAFQSRTLATLLLLQTLADRATARWKKQVAQLDLLPVANLSAAWGPKWPYLAPHAHPFSPLHSDHASSSLDAKHARGMGLPDNWPAWLPPYPVPNMDAMLHDGDYHHTEAHYWTYSRPVGVHHGWVMPEYALAGWPEAGLTTWIEAHTLLTRLADRVPWPSKNSTLMWRGANLVTLRAQLLRAAPYFEPKDWFDIKSSPAGAKDAYMTMAEQCGRFKYLLYTEGHAQSGRLKYQLSCGSLTVTHPPVYREYWTPLLKNGVHWVMLKDTDWTRLPGVMKELRKADEQAQAAAGMDDGGEERDTRAVPPTLLPPMDTNNTPVNSLAQQTYTPEQMARNAVQFARRVFSQDAMSCQAQAAMWAYRRSINWNQFSTRGGGNAKREEHAIRPHPNAVPIKQLAREVLGQWMEVSGGRIRRRRAYHKDQEHPFRGKRVRASSGESESRIVEGQEHENVDFSSPRTTDKEAKEGGAQQ